MPRVYFLTASMRAPAFDEDQSMSQISNDAELLRRITTDPGVCGGRPCIRGFRVRVSDVLDLLAAGASIEEIVNDYPYLEPDDVRAALRYAARMTDHVVVVPAAA
jgi:uncharacterized protein (DUF433 family)